MKLMRIVDVSKSAAMLQAIQHRQLWLNQTVHNLRRTSQSWIYLAEERLDAVGIANTLQSPTFSLFTSFLFFSIKVPIEEEVLQLVEQREDTRLQSDQQFVAVAVLGWSPSMNGVFIAPIVRSLAGITFATSSTSKWGAFHNSTPQLDHSKEVKPKVNKKKKTLKAYIQWMSEKSPRRVNINNMTTTADSWGP